MSKRKRVTVAELKERGEFRCSHCGAVEARKYVRLESYTTRECCCEGYLADDEPRNGDAAEAEPSELSGRGWELWRVE